MFYLKNLSVDGCTCFVLPLGRLCHCRFRSFSSWRSPNPQRVAKSAIFSRTPRPTLPTSGGRLTRCELAMLAGSARVAAMGLSPASTAMVVPSNANTRIPPMTDAAKKKALRQIPGGRRGSMAGIQSEHQDSTDLKFYLAKLTG